MLQTFDIVLSVHHRILMYAHECGETVYCLAAKYRDGRFSPLYPSRYVETDRTRIVGKLKILDEDSKKRVPRQFWFIAQDDVAWRAQDKDIEHANCYIEKIEN